MGTNPFIRPGHQPRPQELERELGSAYRWWERLITQVSNAHAPIKHVWNFGKSTGWSLRLKSDARIVLYMTPGMREFTIGVVLGRHAVERALVEESASLQALIRQGRTFTEGHGIRFVVANPERAAEAWRLVELKMGARQRRSSD